VEIFGDGGVVRDFVYAGDIGRAVVALLGRAELPSRLNVGSGRGVTLSELLRLIEAQAGRPARVVHRPARSFDVPEMVLDVGRLTRLVGEEPTSLDQGLERTSHWLAHRCESPLGVR
jgi:UDP-glucose 4-epimerase